jgi:glutathione synthase/RimK-type ligase-like ATP-grasp enzyme
MSLFVGVPREPVFSPGRVGDDRAILEQVARQLRARGHTAALLDPDESAWAEPPANALVFAMCQGARALARLRAWQDRGLRIVNSPDGVRNCQRHHTVQLLRAAGIAFPESLVLDTAAAPDLPGWVQDGGAWLKRGDFHATRTEDVVRLHSAAELRDGMRDFRQRGIRTAVLQRHVAGRVLKFYAVRGGFFHCVPPADGFVVGAPLERALAALAHRAAGVLGVEVYGGDCVCEGTGRLTLIDLNDWPSYAPCRTEGAEAIAAYLDAQAVAIRT